jgi:hypothetical protein
VQLDVACTNTLAHAVRSDDDRTRATDPDCGCGDGFLEPPQNNVYIELCEGTQFNVSTDCAQYGFRSGTVRCNARCGLDFAGCN